MNMVNRQEQAVQKGVAVAAAIEVRLWPKYAEKMSIQVRTERNYLTKVTLRRKVREPDAAGQGGGVPLS
jgi:hypothetical protein